MSITLDPSPVGSSYTGPGDGRVGKIVLSVINDTATKYTFESLAEYLINVANGKSYPVSGYVDATTSSINKKMSPIYCVSGSVVNAYGYKAIVAFATDTSLPAIASHFEDTVIPI